VLPHCPEDLQLTVSPLAASMAKWWFSRSLALVRLPIEIEDDVSALNHRLLPPVLFTLTSPRAGSLACSPWTQALAIRLDLIGVPPRYRGIRG